MNHHANRALTRRQVLTFMGLGATFSLPLLSGCAADPVTGRQQFMTMSRQDEINIDRQQSPYQFSSDFGALQDERLNSYINQVGQELASRSHRPDMPFSFKGVNAAYINAYAFPGGSIAATRGILVELENEAELAALLGHEIGHVCARHAAEQQSKGMLANILVASASIASSAAGYGGATNLIQGLGNLSAGALLAHYSRDNEREADALGMEYLARTGYAPKGMVGLMEVLLASSKHSPSAIELMFATHPMSDERYQTAVDAAQSTYAAYESAPVQRERYMDHTASLRAIKPAIKAIQQGTAAAGKKRYDEAEQLFTDALQKAPGDYVALVMLAKTHLARKQAEKAQQKALEAAQVYPGEAQAHLIAGAASMVSGDYAQAYAQFDDFDRLLPGNPGITFYKGYSLEHLDRREEAAQQYRRFLDKVRQGKEAQHAYNRLKTWGYLK